MQLVSETDPAAIVEHAIYVRWETAGGGRAKARGGT